MTREQILTLSGPPLSEAVAEHVMLWKRLHTAAVVDQHGSTWEDAQKTWRLIPHKAMRPADAGLFGIVAEVWEPHQDVRAAFAVVDQVTKNGVTIFGAIKNFMHLPNGTWSVGFDQAATNKIRHQVEGLSLAAAICRAALLAVYDDDHRT